MYITKKKLVSRMVGIIFSDAMHFSCLCDLPRSLKSKLKTLIIHSRSVHRINRKFKKKSIEENMAPFQNYIAKRLKHDD